MPEVDVFVVGGGVIGLAVARAAAKRGHSVVLAEANASFGMETSSRNSEVIHAGLYYPTGSLKALLCVQGRQQMYEFADQYGVAYHRCGKLIVASATSQESDLEAIYTKANANGVGDLVNLSKGEIAAREPELNASAALLSPNTGIIDSHAFMLALAGQAEAAGALLVCQSRISRVERSGNGWGIWVTGEEAIALTARNVVNAAGLSAFDVAKVIEGYRSNRDPLEEWAKGNYFGYAGHVPFRSLVYPVPEAGGLGIHLTLDLAGRARFGPDVEWTNRPDYTVDPLRKPAFAKAIASYWPGIDATRLYPDYSGIRPKTSGREMPTSDFVIETQLEHGLPGVVNLFGIESPGLTASLPLAELTVDALAA